jgi:hypothetical protein
VETQQKEAVIESDRRFDKEFQNVIECWPGLKDSARQVWLKEARLNRELPNAKALLRMDSEKDVS